MKRLLALAALTLTLTGCGADDRPAHPLDGASLAELEAKARREGHVVVFSFTSRMADVEVAFEKRYPEIDLVWNELDSTTQIARIVGQRRSGIGDADVAYLADAPIVLSELVEREALVRYVPPWLGERVPASATSPLLAQRLLTKVLLYDGRAFGDRAPVDNLWELTEPHWRGRVAMVDPLERGDYLDLLTEVALHSDEMEAAYRARYGRAPQLGDARNAGERWILDLLANDPRVVPAGADATDQVNALIGRADPDHALVGFSSYSDVQDNADTGRDLRVATGVAPAPGIAYPALTGIVSGTESPAAARLLIAFLMGDGSADGGPGYAPFRVPGDYPTRRDVTPHPDAVSLEELGAWPMAPTETLSARRRVAELILATMP